MEVSLEEAKRYLRVDYDDEDDLIQSFIETGERLSLDTLRKDSSSSPAFKIAILFAVAYLFEHREDADMNELTKMLRYILMSDREIMF